MKNLQLFEDFKQGTMEKPQGFFSRIASGAKKALGFENEEDRKSLETLHNATSAARQQDWVSNVREIKPGVIVAWLNDNSFLVDKNTPEIIYKGKTLDLQNVEDEAGFLYDKLVRIKNRA